MRAAALLLAFTLLLPGAGALGVTSPVVSAQVDAPLVAPIAFERPLAPPPPEKAAQTTEAPAVSPPVVDGTLDGAPVIEIAITPPEVMAGAAARAPLAPRDALDAPIAPRAALLAPQVLDAPLAPALPLDEAGPARVRSSPSAPAPAPEPTAGSASREEVPAPPEPGPSWPALAAAGATLLLLPLALLLYHRIRGRSIGESPARRAILARLAERPGMGAAELAREGGVDPTTMHYHLRRLAREGLVVAHGPSRSPRYFAAGAQPPEERARLAASLASAQVLAAVQGAPGADKSGIARQLAISRTTVAWHLASLERAGLVRQERAGRSTRIYPTSF